MRGEFDDCQRLVKAAFADAGLREAHRLCSANSINVGRLLPQAAYYALSSLEHYRRHGVAAELTSFRPAISATPSPVCGRRMWACPSIASCSRPTPTPPSKISSPPANGCRDRPCATLASAMDVGNPSNMERVRDLCGDIDTLRTEVSAVAVSDDEIRATIRDEYARHRAGLVPAYGDRACTSIAICRRPNGAIAHWIVGGDGASGQVRHALSSRCSVRAVAPPPELMRLLDLPASHERIDPDLPQLAARLAVR